MIESFYLIPAGCDPTQVQEIIQSAESAGCNFCDIYDLRSGDPSAWNETDATDGEGETFIALLHAGWQDAFVRDAIDKSIEAPIGIYIVDEVHIMVDGGYPTPVGLRGLDAVRTIMEAGADNQLTAAVVKDIYDIDLVPPE